jgi:N-acyl-D-aspartate/D-glutamate deacylase
MPTSALACDESTPTTSEFIDMHTHGDIGLLEDLDAATISRQGVTTIVVGHCRT